MSKFLFYPLFKHARTEVKQVIVSGCAPPPGTYDPKSPISKTIKGAKFNRAQRFKEPSSVPQVSVIYYTIVVGTEPVYAQSAVSLLCLATNPDCKISTNLHTKS